MSDIRHAHYVLSAHWDREWYQPFQEYRYRLVNLMDEVLDGLDTGELRGPYQTDGQVVMIEDYLEVRNDRRNQIHRLAKDGTLRIGPWYVLPDEFLVAGESLIRNIERGHRVARQLGGEPSKAGFLCDLFGHNSQMPQIFRQFGIRGGFLWRGINLQTGVIRWRGADGTEMPCHVFGFRGYCNYANHVREAFRTSVGRPFDSQECRKRLDDFIAQEKDRVRVGPLLLFDGGDHQEWDRPVYRVLAERFDTPHNGVQCMHTSLDAYCEELLTSAQDIQAVLEGELREPGLHPGHVHDQFLIPGVLSSRVWIKQENAACETLLIHWAEPMAAVDSLSLGAAYPDSFLDVAWGWLLKNHPHDSICGCSIDQVHEDMKFRFSQCRQIAHHLTTESLKRVAGHVEAEPGDDELRVTVFNPLPYERDEVFDLDLRIPTDWPTFQEFFGFESKPAFHLHDMDGQPLSYQRIGQGIPTYETIIERSTFPFQRSVHPVQVSVQLKLPAMGYTTLLAKAAPAGKEEKVAVYPTRHPGRPGLATSDRSMANEYLEVTVHSNGSLHILDKRNGMVYDRLMTFEDVADIGDGWYHGQAVNDAAATSVSCSADVEMVANNPLLATLRVRTKMLLPAAFDFNQMRRDVDRRRELIIDNRITLRRHSDRVEVSTHVNNTIRDHRLRVLMPSDVESETYLSDSAFDVIARPIALRCDNHEYRELEVETKPQQSWSAVFAGQRGLAIVTTGLKEAAVIDTPERPLALTLYRSTRRTVFTDGEPDGQLMMPLDFHYWIIPLTEAPDAARLTRTAQMLAAGIRTVQLRRDEVTLNARRDLPAHMGILRVAPEVVMSAFRVVHGACELRVFNPKNVEVCAKIELHERLAKDIRTARRVDFEHQPVGEPLALDCGRFELMMRPKEIATVCLMPGPPLDATAASAPGGI